MSIYPSEARNGVDASSQLPTVGEAIATVLQGTQEVRGRIREEAEYFKRRS